MCVCVCVESYYVYGCVSVMWFPGGVVRRGGHGKCEEHRGLAAADSAADD